MPRHSYSSHGLASISPGTKDQAQGVVDVLQFLVAEASEEVAEALGRDGGGLFDEHLSLLVLDRDRRPEELWLG